MRRESNGVVGLAIGALASQLGAVTVSDADLEAALEDAGAAPETTEAALAAYADARLDGLRSALAILAALALLALFLAQSIPTRPIGIDERKE